MRVLCILTTILGHKTACERLTGALDRLKDVDPIYVFVTRDDYLRYRAPRWARLSDPWEAQFVARRKAEPFLKQPFDALLVNCWELAVAFRDVAARVPSAVVMDAVPATIRAQLRQQGISGFKRSLADWAHHRAFSRAAKHLAVFFPKSSVCSASLQQDYGVAADRCFVTLAPQHLDVWKPCPQRPSAPPVRLLFVGNDFARKGGELLLRLYSERLSDKCTLTIASNDPALTARALPAGVELLRDHTRDQLLPVFQRSHLFVFPTQQDYTPEVVAEALAAGVPCVTGEVDGTRDLIRDGENGFVMPRAAGFAQWAERLSGLVADPEQLRHMSQVARRFAEEKLDFEKFETMLGSALDRLRPR
ncbi:MAG TPA: glycosyltransferase family 4 protein [Bryobacteraceae bacterium]|nr:glycosyltransferase family 4 protein [Bryobacteraceae bacterium]